MMKEFAESCNHTRSVQERQRNSHSQAVGSAEHIAGIILEKLTGSSQGLPTRSQAPLKGIASAHDKLLSNQHAILSSLKRIEQAVGQPEKVEDSAEACDDHSEEEGADECDDSVMGAGGTEEHESVAYQHAGEELLRHLLASTDTTHPPSSRDMHASLQPLSTNVAPAAASAFEAAAVSLQSHPFQQHLGFAQPERGCTSQRELQQHTTSAEVAQMLKSPSAGIAQQQPFGQIKQLLTLYEQQQQRPRQQQQQQEQPYQQQQLYQQQQPYQQLYPQQTYQQLQQQRHPQHDPQEESTYSGTFGPLRLTTSVGPGLPTQDAQQVLAAVQALVQSAKAESGTTSHSASKGVKRKGKSAATNSKKK